VTSNLQHHLGNIEDEYGIDLKVMLARERRKRKNRRDINREERGQAVMRLRLREERRKKGLTCSRPQQRKKKKSRKKGK